MRLDQLIVGNYRAFAQRRAIALRPITLFYGWNNAGKSALLRLLAMLGDSVMPTSPGPLDTSRALDRGGGFQSLLSRYGMQADLDPDALQIGLHWDDGFQCDVELKLRDGLQYVRRVSSRVGNDPEVAFVATRGDSQYLRESVNAGTPIRIDFEGLVPLAPELAPIAEHLRTLRQTVQWLKATRARPPRRFEPRGVKPRLLACDGSDAIEALAMDDEVLRAVAKWYSDAVQRDLVLREEASQERRLLLRPPGTAMDIDLVDTGEGMSQCLPVLVASAMAKLRGSPRVLAFEEPESHLHPRAQAELARFLCEVAAAESAPCFALETHSFSMLLGVQLAIATGVISAESVILHWIDSERSDQESALVSIEFDSVGRPKYDGALPVFAKESELANELAAVQSGSW